MKRACALNESMALFLLGLLHRYGVRGVKQDDYRPFSLLCAAATCGQPQAGSSVGLQLAFGHGVKKDFVESMVVSKRRSTRRIYLSSCIPSLAVMSVG